MIPKYPFCVSVWRKVGNKLDLRTKSFETLQAASAYSGVVLRGADVRRVQLYCILEDQNRNDLGSITHFDREARA